MGRGYGDQGDGWDDDETAGRPCACGRDCAERDYQGNPQRGPRPFCRTDEVHVGAVIRGLPERYTELSLRLVPSGQQDERVSGGSREAPAPLDLEVQAHMRHLVLVAVTWEWAVRDAAGLSQPDLCPACDGYGAITAGQVTAACDTCHGDGMVSSRDGVVLQRACRLLAGQDGGRPGYLVTLLSLPPLRVTRPVPGNRAIRDLAPGSVIRVDSSGDAWEEVDADGTAAGLEFLRVNGRVRAMLGLSLQKRRVPVRCDGCQQLTLTQREAAGGGWEDVARCSNCPQAYIGDEFTGLMTRWYQAGQKAARAAEPG